MAKNTLRTQALLANIDDEILKKKYLEGLVDSPEDYRAAAAASLIGADIAEGYNKWANNTLSMQAIDKRQNEIASRSDSILANLASTSEKVQAIQKTAFIKSGVKLEGSAIDVVTETAMQGMEAAKVRQREADFEIGAMEVEKALSKMRAKYAPVETLLNIGKSALLAGVK